MRDSSSGRDLATPMGDVEEPSAPPPAPVSPSGGAIGYTAPPFRGNLPGHRNALRAIVLTVLVLLVLTGTCFFHYGRHYVPGILSVEAQDTVQAAREFARTRHFNTLVVYPLLTGVVSANLDGTMPDVSHSVLFTALAGTLMRLRGQSGPSAGDVEATLLTLACFMVSCGACWLLSRRLFGERGALLALLLYALGGTALAEAIHPQPLFLGVTLFSLLLVALHAADGIPSAGKPERRIPLGWSALAGLLFGLLYLTLYSALLLLPAILYHLWRGARRRLLPAAVFLAVAVVVTAPVLLRTFRLTRNPLYNARALELVMHTETFSGRSLYRQADMPQSIPRYLASGGWREVGSKAGRNLIGFYRDAPSVLGLFVLPLLLGASLTRFTDGRVNRLRGTVYLCAGVHVLGLSLFQPHRENLPLLLLYAPFAAVLGTSFLLSIVRARNLPIYFARATVLGWTLLACVPGLAILLAERPSFAVPSRLFDVLNAESPHLGALRQLPPDRQGLLIAERPWELAFRCDHPSVWMPADSGAFQSVEARTGMRIEGVMLTPGLPRDYAEDQVAAPWRMMYSRITSLTITVANLDAPTRQVVVDRVRLFYPEQLVTAMRPFRPQPVSDREEGSLALMFWREDTPRTPAAP
jgi:hypothetical protein